VTPQPDPRPDDSEASYEIVELTEARPAMSARLGSPQGVLGSLLQLSDAGPLERVRDPLFQAFVATGFSRPR
jgi:hypothetical protein